MEEGGKEERQEDEEEEDDPNILPDDTSKRGHYLNDETLAPDGAWKVRLCRHKLHLPQDCEVVVREDDTDGRIRRESPKCRLHAYLGRRSAYKIIFCPDCNINLCVHCYTVFHKEKNLPAKKEELQAKYGIKNKKNK